MESPVSVQFKYLINSGTFVCIKFYFCTRPLACSPLPNVFFLILIDFLAQWTDAEVKGKNVFEDEEEEEEKDVEKVWNRKECDTQQYLIQGNLLLLFYIAKQTH